VALGCILAPIACSFCEETEFGAGVVFLAQLLTRACHRARISAFAVGDGLSGVWRIACSNRYRGTQPARAAPGLRALQPQGQDDPKSGGERFVASWSGEHVLNQWALQTISRLTLSQCGTRQSHTLLSKGNSQTHHLECRLHPHPHSHRHRL